MIEATPAVKSQSGSASPGIATAPRSVVQVPMTDGEPTGLGEVSVSVTVMLPAAQAVSDEEEEKDEDEQSGHNDDEEDVDDINHADRLRRWSARTVPPKDRRQWIFGSM